MSDLELQKFSVRIDAALADGVITPEQSRLAKAALEGGGMEAALEALRSSVLAKADSEPGGDDAAAPVPEPAGEDPDRVAMAELRDELSQDLGSARALELIREIAAAQPPAA